MTSPLGKLQCQVDKLSQNNTKLRDKIAELKTKNYYLGMIKK